MEYMLLRDGSIKLFECLSEVEDVVDALHDYDGIAYYWCNTAFQWSCVKPDHTKYSPTQMNKSDVPEVIRLAAMLE